MRLARALCFKGGGGKGVIEAVFADALEKGVSERTGRSVRLGEYVDLFAGTSTGAIIAAALALREGPSVPLLTSLYQSGIPEVFRTSGWRRFVTMNWWATREEKYADEGLNGLLYKVFGDARLGDCETPLLVLAWDVEAGRLRRFRSYDPKDRRVLVADAVRASCAAPTFFEPWLVEGRVYVDGGLAANDPSARAYQELHLHWNGARLDVGENTGTSARKMALVALGPGRIPSGIEEPKKTSSWGVVQWARPLVQIAMGAAGDEVDEQLRANFAAARVPFQYVRIEPDLSEERPEVRAMDTRDAAVVRRWVNLAREMVLANEGEFALATTLLVEGSGESRG